MKIECCDITGEVYATGSGFVAFDSDLIVTNYHVVEDHPYAITALAEDAPRHTQDPQRGRQRHASSPPSPRVDRRRTGALSDENSLCLVKEPCRAGESVLIYRKGDAV